jgi:hypothetical protein
MKRIVALCCFFVLRPSLALAEPVRLWLDCLQIDQAAVRRLVGVELGSALAVDGTNATSRVLVRCDAQRVQLTFEADGRTLRRDVDLEGVAREGRNRLLALAIAELVAASRSELTPEVAAPIAPAPAATPASTATAMPTLARDDMRRFRLSISATGRGFFAGTGLLGGAGVRLAKHHAHHLGWLADIDFVHGRGSSALGTVSSDVLSVGTALQFHKSWSRISVQGGVGLRGGAARLGGDAMGRTDVTASSLWAPWGGAMLAGGASFAPTRRLLVELGIEAGYTFLPVRGLITGQDNISVEGAWVGLQIGIGAFL